MRNPAEVTILVVDDEPALRSAIAFDLLRKGYVVLEAGDGREAFEIVRGRPVDLVLTDVRMPGGDGVQLLDDVKSLNPRLPVVIFITGCADISNEEAYDRGADAIFSKPFDRRQLLAAVERAVNPIREFLGHKRWECADSHLRVDLSYPGLGVAARGSLFNIGRGGFFMKFEGPVPPVEGRVCFRIGFDDGDPDRIDGHGLIRWVRPVGAGDCPPGYGIEIDYLEENSRDRVLGLLENLRVKAFIPKK